MSRGPGDLVFQELMEAVDFEARRPLRLSAPGHQEQPFVVEDLDVVTLDLG